MWWQKKHIHNTQLDLGGEFATYTIPKEGDKITFEINAKVLIYQVKERYLQLLLVNGMDIGAYNELIFNELGMSEQQKLDFATKAFGYYAIQGRCPVSHPHDFKALGRLLYLLKLECLKYNNHVVAE